MMTSRTSALGLSALLALAGCRSSIDAPQHENAGHENTAEHAAAPEHAAAENAGAHEQPDE
ncbi:MAG: hypothetical protein GXP55_05640, partial [Deltaproteobacteria bacterium]|nr:hypothetical protein [Deltaproteobacteria bacterium]